MELILRCAHRSMTERQLNSNSHRAGGTPNDYVLLCRGHRMRKCFFMCVRICPFIFGVCVCAYMSVREHLVTRTHAKIKERAPIAPQDKEDLSALVPQGIPATLVT